MSINEKLLDLQNEISGVKKESKNPFYNSKYFDINTLIDTLKPYLKKHGLLLLQPIEDGCVVTRVIDVDSGDAYESGIPLPSIGDPQKLGSAITYYRRYTLQSLLALQAEDDDGNMASKPEPKNEKPKLTPTSVKWKGAVENLAKGKVTLKKIEQHYSLTDKHKNQLQAEARQMGEG